MSDTPKVEAVAAKPKFLSRSDIIAASANSLAPNSVQVDDWGGPVRYKPMTMTERRQIRKRSSTKEPDPITNEMTMTLDVEKFEVLALIHCCLDPEDDSALLFQQGDDVMLETKMAAGPISVVSTDILRSSGLAPEAVKRGQSGAQA